MREPLSTLGGDEEIARIHFLFTFSNRWRECLNELGDSIYQPSGQPTLINRPGLFTRGLFSGEVRTPLTSALYY